MMKIFMLLLLSAVFPSRSFALEAGDIKVLGSLRALAADSVPQPGTAQESPVSAGTVSSGQVRATVQKEWTILLYINGNNNLDPYFISYFQDIQKMGGLKNINVVVEAGVTFSTTATSNTSDFTNLRLSVDDRGVISLPQRNYVDMGDYKELVDFASWGKKAFPAKHTMLIIANHGGGFMDHSMKPVSRGISYDSVSHNFITTPQLGQALQAIGGVDALVFHACLMQMLEVDYQVRAYAPVIAGSEETLFISYDYEYPAFFRALDSRAAASGEDAAKMFTDTFVSNMKEKSLTGHFSVVRTGQLEKLSSLLGDWGRMAMDLNDSAAIVNAKELSLYFDSGSESEFKLYGDIVDFIGQVNSHLTVRSAKANAFRAKGEEIIKFINNSVVAYYRYEGNDSFAHMPFSRAHGLSILLPWSRPGAGTPVINNTGNGFLDLYSGLDFAKASGWWSFASYACNLRHHDSR